MAVRRQRATTSEKYTMSEDRIHVINKAKKRHRIDEEFYIAAIEMGSLWFYDVSVSDFELIYKGDISLMKEHFKFESGRWHSIKA